MTVDIPDKPQRKTSVGLLAPESVNVVKDDFRAIRVDHGPEINALRAPQIPENFGAGFFAGAQRLAAGVSALGGFMTHVAEKVGEAKSAQQVNDAEVEMAKMHGDFQAMMDKNPNDPDSWGVEWERQATDLHKRLLADKGLTPIARDAIDASWKRFAATKGASIQGAMVRQQFSNTKDSYIANGLQRAKDGDYTGAIATFKKAEEEGLTRPVETFHLKDQVSRMQKSDVLETAKTMLAKSGPLVGGYDQARELLKANADVLGKTDLQTALETVDSKERSDAVLQEIIENPVEALKKLNSYGEDGEPTNYSWMQPGERMQYSAQARGAVALQSKEDADRYLAVLSVGGIKDEKHARSFFSEATPKDEVEKYVAIWRQGRGETKPQYLEALNEIEAFDISNAKGDRAEREANLRKEIAFGVSPTEAIELQNYFTERLKGDKEALHSAKHQVSKGVLELDSAGLLGVNYSGQEQALAAIQDPKVLKALGIAPESVSIGQRAAQIYTLGIFGGKATPSAIRTVRGPQAFQMFKDAAKKSKINIDLYNALDPKQKAIVEDVLHGTSIDTAADLRLESMSRAEKVIQEWNEHLKTHPEDATSEKANKFLQEVQTRYGGDAINNTIEKEKKKTSALPRVHTTAPGAAPKGVGAGAGASGGGVNGGNLPEWDDFDATLDAFKKR